MKVQFVNTTDENGNPEYATMDLAGYTFAVGEQGEMAILKPGQETPIALLAAGVWRHILPIIALIVMFVAAPAFARGYGGGGGYHSYSSGSSYHSYSAPSYRPTPTYRSYSAPAPTAYRAPSYSSPAYKPYGVRAPSTTVKPQASSSPRVVASSRAPSQRALVASPARYDGGWNWMHWYMFWLLFMHHPQPTAPVAAQHDTARVAHSVRP